MSELPADYDVEPTPFAIRPTSELKAKSAALQQALGEIERLKAQVADLQRRIDLLLDGDGILLGSEVRDV